MERNANAYYDLMSATVEAFNDVSNSSDVVWFEAEEDCE